ncbi:hypothetical protein KKC97_13510 [bacterium]|nr:hypothetical protein [bacterium]MBU1638675.1 hypothetical protein [bacterium]MBU1920849.1 hypothetical protein [bacterium]
MKYLINSHRSVEEWADIERDMPARSKVADQIVENFKPEVFYFYADRAGMMMIVDIDKPEKLTEISLLLRRAGLQTSIYPLASKDDIQGIMMDMATMV